MPDVFISYSRKDIAFARLLHEALTQGKVETWIDWARIPVGEKWWNEISAAISQSDIFLFIISSHSIGSEICKKEVDQALSHNKRIIPIIVDNTPEAAIRAFVPDLTAINWIIFQRDDVFLLEARPNQNLKPEEQMVALPKTPAFRLAVEKLNTAIHTDWAWVKAHTRLETRAQEWDQRQRDGSWLLHGKDLVEAESWLAQAGAKKDPQPTDLQRQFVLSSRKAESRRQRLTLWASLGALGLLSIFLVVAIISRRTALVNLARSESLRLAAESENILAQPYGNVETAALLSLRAQQGGYLPQADAPLQKSLLHLYAMRTFSGPTGAVTSVAFSPDGKYVLTGSLDKTARLWDSASGALVRTFSGHTALVESVAFSPDGKFVLTGSADMTARLWETTTGAQVRTFSDPTSTERTSVEKKRSNHAVAFSPDGKYVLTGALDDTARLWNAATGEQVLSFELTGWVLSVAFSPDGNYVLTGGTNDDPTLWMADTGAQVRTFVGDAKGAIDVAFSPDGNNILTVSLGQQTAKLWGTASGALVRTFSGHTDTLESAAFSPDGMLVLTGSSDNTAKLWDAVSNTQVRTFSGLTDAVNSIAFSPDGKYVLTGSSDKTARLWDTATNAIVRTFSGHTDIVESVVFSPDGKYVLTGSDDTTARLWEAASGAEVRTFKGHTGAVYSVAFSPDGKYVLTGGADRTARLWEAGTGAAVRTFSGHTQHILGVAFSPDGKFVLTGSADWNAILWEAASGKPVRTFKGESSVEAVAFSPDGKYVLTANYERTATLWEAATGVSVRTFKGHTSYVSSVAFSPDGKYVLTGSYDSQAKLWNASTGLEVRTFGGHTDALTGVAFSPDGKYVLTGSLDTTVDLWNTDSVDTLRWACAHLTLDLTAQERTQYFITDTRPTCSAQVPALITPGNPMPLETLAASTKAAPLPKDVTVTPTRNPLLPPALNWDVNVSDPLSANVNKWPTWKHVTDNCSDSSLEFQNGTLLWTLSALPGNWCSYFYYPGIMVVSDFDASVDIKRSLGNGKADFGLAFRIIDADNHYLFAISDTDRNFEVRRYLNGSALALEYWKYDPAIKTEGSNHLAVSARGNKFYFYINDTLVDTLKDSEIGHGHTGITTEIYDGGNVSVSYSNFQLHGTK